MYALKWHFKFCSITFELDFDIYSCSFTAGKVVSVLTLTDGSVLLVVSILLLIGIAKVSNIIIRLLLAIFILNSIYCYEPMKL